MGSNAELAAMFARMAEVMQLVGENAFKAIAFQRVARVLEETNIDVVAAARSGELPPMEGIGESSKRIIIDYAKTGRSADYEQVIARVPAAVLQMVRIPGMGPKTAALLWKERGIESIDALEQAIAQGKLAGLKGVGEKKIASMLDGIRLLKAGMQRRGFVEVAPLVEKMLEMLGSDKRVGQAEAAGSFRRRRETVGDVDLLCWVHEAGWAAALSHPSGRKLSINAEEWIKAHLEYVVVPFMHGSAVRELRASLAREVGELKEGDDLAAVLRYIEDRLMVQFSDGSGKPRFNAEVPAHPPKVILRGWDEVDTRLRQYLDRCLAAASGLHWRRDYDAELPREPGVYMFRDQGTRSVSQGYVGIAGPRDGKGLRDRIYKHFRDRDTSRGGDLPNDSLQKNVARMILLPQTEKGLSVGDAAQAVIDAFCSQAGVEKVNAQGRTKGSILVDNGFQVDLRIVPKANFGAALLYFTGSKDHNVKLRGMAQDKGMTLNEWGMYRLDQYDRAEKKPGEPPALGPVAAADEKGVYAALKMEYIEPELREDRGEIEAAAAHRLPRLVTQDDIRGELHCHTTASDGRASIEEMAEAAKAMGYEYIAITDHSASSVIANGLGPQRLKSHIKAIRKAQDHVKGIHILAGSEVDILVDGSLDYEDALLAELDVVIASPHVSLKQETQKGTDRLLRAIESRYVHIIGHPTGRMINQREGLPLDMPKIFAAAAAAKTALEINSGWPRWDLNDLNARAAANAGALISINTDAHAIEGLRDMGMGLWVARRAWLTPPQIVNCMPYKQLVAWLKAKR